MYGTGIQGTKSPRAISATAAGSATLNLILSKNFVLAQADESFVKLTDMTSVNDIAARLDGFEAVFLATRCTLETRPVTGGTYEKGPNDKTLEFYMDRPRSPTVRGVEDPDYALQLFQNTVAACKQAGVKRMVGVE